MNVPEKLFEVMQWTQLGYKGICKRSCNNVVIDGLDYLLPKMIFFQLKNGNFAEADVYGTRYYKSSTIGYGLE